LLVSILLPALGHAKELANNTLCASNQKQIFLAMQYYGQEYDGWFGPTQNDYYAPGWSFTHEYPPVPQQLVDFGIGFYFTQPPDFYLALGYLENEPSVKLDRGDDPRTDRVPNNPVLQCPLAKNRRGEIFWRYEGNRGQVECHYFFSDLMDAYLHNWKSSLRQFIQTNTYGPYRQEELTKPEQTLLLGDAIAEESHPSYYNKYVTAPRTRVYCDVSMQRHLRYYWVGTSILWFGQYRRDWGALDLPPDYTHVAGIPGTFWDGHGEITHPPSESNPYELRKYITRNGQPDDDGTPWDNGP
jgi:hypothetical protein